MRGANWLMSVRNLEEDLQFVQTFHGYIVQYIAAVNGWEQIDAQVGEIREGGKTEYYYSEEQFAALKKHESSYRSLRDTINLEVIRVRNIASRYQLAFNENWIYNIPTQRPKSGQQYMCTFDESIENAIYRDIFLIRGAISDNLKSERRREARPWYVKVWDDRMLPTLQWFVRPEHSKFTLIALLAIAVAVVLRALGYDGKVIVEIVKAIRGKD